jgi:dual-action HEIGH metallo-peptidase
MKLTVIALLFASWVGAEQPPDSGVGYELFWNDKRVGNEPKWNVGQAIDNFRWNVENRPQYKVESRLNGRKLYYLKSVKVLPLFYVPADQPQPGKKQIERLVKHLQLTKQRYREMLGGKLTFGLVEQPPAIVNSKHDLAWMRKDYNNEALGMTCELLAHFKVDRFNCPYVFLIVVMNKKDGFPAGGGRPLNGGLNRGGGVAFMSSFELDRNKNFQSTLQHELGHGFGLTHTNVYAKDMSSGRSIMSYNLKHHYRGFEAPADSGTLIPEDLRALSANQLVFKELTFDPQKDVPKEYKLFPRFIVLNPMPLDCKSAIAPPVKR